MLTIYTNIFNDVISPNLSSKQKSLSKNLPEPNGMAKNLILDLCGILMINTALVPEPKKFDDSIDG